MSKKSLLSCTAVATSLLFITHFNTATAADLTRELPPLKKIVINGENKEESNQEIHSIKVLNSGKFIGKNLTVKDVEKGKNNIPSSVEISDNSSVEFWNTNIILNDSNNQFAYGIDVRDGSSLAMTNGSIMNSNIGISLGHDENDTVQNNATLEDVKISSNYIGIVLSGKSTATLKNVTIKGQESLSVLHNSTLKMSGGSVDGEVASSKGGNIILDNVTVTSDKDGLIAGVSASRLSMTGGSITAGDSALKILGGLMDITDVSSIKAGKIGIVFTPDSEMWPNPENAPAQISLVNTTLHVEDGVGIDAIKSRGEVNLKNSKILADTLFINEKDDNKTNAMFTLTAEQSVLQGNVRNNPNGRITFDLKNGTKWIVKTSQKAKGDDNEPLDIAQRSHSDISVLNLNGSKLIFDKPLEEHYHTLYIGTGKSDITAVYNASGNAEIHFNTEWSNNVAVKDQKTDRLIIDGDASGTTTVYITDNSKDKYAIESQPSNISGLSLIQVSGKATEDSFKLAKGYITRNGSPYKYVLTAHGPQSSHGMADVSQSLFNDDNKNFWDFRLQHQFLDSDSKVHALVSQAASYAVMPHALFTAGISDIAKQEDLLADIRTTQNFSFFLSPYGNTATLTSERGALKYGYDADILYTAAQVGGAVAALEGKDINMHLGLMGTYGQLSFTPKNMEDVDKSTLNKWSITAYGTLQHNNGMYFDVLASYGILSGDINTKLTKSTAQLKDTNTWSASAIIGKEFATDTGIAFEPQAQLIYQQLSFENIKDADKLEVDMKNPSQWLARIGARVTKTIASTEKDNSTSFYGKLNFLTAFGDDTKIKVGKDSKTGKDFNIDLESVRSSIEGGLGIKANLSKNFSIHADVSYQQKLQKAGISGANFSGGIRYQF
ncbi:autotransporter outer membrane beta-barrel domain-containing protein [Bartonella doshiae]|uniref:autotransporter outer membrane beta-barrel domain-containing protein n=1 Tax=Bartonella doshiae TaxID=33044 RepID=UPI00094542E4|nr:autotransporter outer membrane beta-barrel domain-containing protein [Bartonella doshiae]